MPALDTLLVRQRISAQMLVAYPDSLDALKREMTRQAAQSLMTDIMGANGPVLVAPPKWTQHPPGSLGYDDALTMDETFDLRVTRLVTGMATDDDWNRMERYMTRGT